jgi:hypothetical protein
MAIGGAEGARPGPHELGASQYLFGKSYFSYCGPTL